MGALYIDIARPVRVAQCVKSGGFQLRYQSGCFSSVSHLQGVSFGFVRYEVHYVGGSIHSVMVGGVMILVAVMLTLVLV